MGDMLLSWHIDVYQHTQAVEQIESACAMRNIAGRIAVPKERFQPRVAGFGNDLAMPVRIKFVNDDTVVACQVSYHLHHRIGQNADRWRCAEALHGIGQDYSHHIGWQVVQLRACRRAR